MKPPRTLGVLWVIISLAACTASTTPVPALPPDSSPTPEPSPTPTQAEEGATIPWETYHNETYGFTFEYPAVYAADAYLDSCGIKESNEGIHLGLRSELMISDSGGLELAEFTDNLLQSKGWSADSQKNATVDGLEAITIEYRIGGTNRFGTFTSLKYGEEIYTFGFSAGSFCETTEGGVTEPAAYAHMLESFRFIR